jgi:hypothetical protein
MGNIIHALVMAMLSWLTHQEKIMNKDQIKGKVEKECRQGPEGLWRSQTGYSERQIKPAMSVL